MTVAHDSIVESLNKITSSHRGEIHNLNTFGFAMRRIRNVYFIVGFIIFINIYDFSVLSYKYYEKMNAYMNGLFVA